MGNVADRLFTKLEKMIHGIGVDIVEIPRIQRLLENWGNRFLQRVFTAAEISYCSQKVKPAGCYALRFAAKEAFSKALGLGMSDGLSFRQIEVLKNKRGKPYLDVHGRSKELCEDGGVQKTFLSLSDDGRYAVAMVVLER